MIRFNGYREQLMLDTNGNTVDYQTKQLQSIFKIAVIVNHIVLYYKMLYEWHTLVHQTHMNYITCF